jgi:hypothetical protein
VTSPIFATDTGAIADCDAAVGVDAGVVGGVVVFMALIKPKDNFPSHWEQPYQVFGAVTL